MDNKTYIYFWGHHDKDNGYLSNFYPCKFKDDKNITYSCSEQYFMKKKQELFDENNVSLSRNIMAEQNPKNIKQYGRLVKNFDQDIWDLNKYNIMIEALTYKFNQNKDLKDKLINTRNKILVEAAPNDKIWGIGMNGIDAQKGTEKDWKGQNLLGKALVEVIDSITNN